MVKKIKHYNTFKILKKHQNSILLIGNFDGLHAGHQKLFKLANKYKKKTKKKIGVLTFNPIPKMFFNKKLKNYRISNLNQKINLMKNFSIDFVIMKKFDNKFSKIKSTNFINKTLYKDLKVKYIFVSNNFRFGNKRQGDVNLLKKFQNKFKYNVINPNPLKKNKVLVSSSLIRKLLQEGNLKKANQFLKRNWSVEGIVKRGRKIGKKIGFPTCNIELNDYVVPMKGVYAVNVYKKNSKKILKGIANLGYRPTFNQKKILLEVNIFNFSGNLYNKKLRVDFLKFIRKEKKFNGIDKLRKQINLDITVAQKI